MIRSIAFARRRLNRTSGIFVALVAYTVPVAVWLISIAGHRDQHAALVDLAPCLSVLAGAVLCAAAARNPSLDPRLRRTWRLLAWGSASYLAGLVGWLVIVDVLGGDGFPSAATIGFAGWYPFVLAALFAIPRAAALVGERRSLLFDAGAVAIGAGCVVWVEILTPLTATMAVDAPTVVVSAAFAVADLLVLVAVLHAFARAPTRSPEAGCCWSASAACSPRTPCSPAPSRAAPRPLRGRQTSLSCWLGSDRPGRRRGRLAI